MIYTVTFNPSLDYIVRADHFAVGEVNRTTYEQILEGGKGLNVSVVLKNMGLDSVALGLPQALREKRSSVGWQSGA